MAEQKRPNIINDLGARVMAVTLSLDGDNNGNAVDVFIVSSYALISAHSEAEWEAYYDALSAALARRPPKAITIIGADTNASMSIDIEATLVILTMISEASMWLGVLRLRESMTPVGGYESSWRHTKSQRFQLASTRNTTRTLLERTHAPNVRTKSTTFWLSVKTCVTFLMLAQSVGNSSIRITGLSKQPTLRSLLPPKKKTKLKNDRQGQRLMRLDYAILQ